MSIKEAKKILGFDSNSVLTIDMITKRYRKLMKEYHPDKHMNDKVEKIDEYNDKTILLNEAYQFLKDNFDKVNKDIDDSIEFYRKKNRAVVFAMRYYKDSKNSELKNKVIKIFETSGIKEATNENDLNLYVDRFMISIRMLYKNELKDFFKKNGIPSHYSYGFTYNTDVDGFIKGLNEVKNKHDNYINETVRGIVKNSSLEIEFTDSRAFRELKKSYVDELMDSELTRSSEDDIINSFASKVSELSRRFNRNIEEYYDAVNRIERLDDNFEKEMDREVLLEELNISIIDDYFDEKKKYINNVIDNYYKKKRLIRKLKLSLMIKYKMAILKLHPVNDKTHISSALDTYENILKILSEAENGKYSVNDLMVLENITFTNASKDAILLSIFNSNSYNIYIEYPKNGKTKKFNPIVLGNANVDNYICYEDDELVVKTREEIEKDSNLLSLNVFVNNGNIINLSRRTHTTYDTLICQYGDFDLLYIQDLKTKEGRYYLRPIKYRRENAYDNLEALLLLEEDICNRFIRDINKFKKSRSSKTLRINKISL